MLFTIYVGHIDRYHAAMQSETDNYPGRKQPRCHVARKRRLVVGKPGFPSSTITS